MKLILKSILELILKLVFKLIYNINNKLYERFLKPIQSLHYIIYAVKKKTDF